MCMWLGPSAGASVTALYAFPCVIAGWAFGASGGLMVGMLTTPVHAWLFRADLINSAPGGVAPFLGLVSAVVVGMSVGVARDLRERLRENGAALAESEDRYRQLVDNSPEGVLVHERGVIVFANASMARLVGEPEPARLVGRTLITLAPFEDREALASAFVHDARKTRALDARLLRGAGEVRVEMRAMPIHYRGARASMVIVKETPSTVAPYSRREPVVRA